jgi:hypothetical protein
MIAGRKCTALFIIGMLSTTTLKIDVTCHLGKGRDSIEREIEGDVPLINISCPSLPRSGKQETTSYIICVVLYSWLE